MPENYNLSEHKRSLVNSYSIQDYLNTPKVTRGKKVIFYQLVFVYDRSLLVLVEDLAVRWRTRTNQSYIFILRPFFLLRRHKNIRVCFGAGGRLRARERCEMNVWGRGETSKELISANESETSEGSTMLLPRKHHHQVKRLHRTRTKVR